MRVVEIYPDEWETHEARSLVDFFVKGFRLGGPGDFTGTVPLVFFPIRKEIGAAAATMWGPKKGWCATYLISRLFIVSI